MMLKVFIAYVRAVYSDARIVGNLKRVFRFGVPRLASLYNEFEVIEQSLRASLYRKGRRLPQQQALVVMRHLLAVDPQMIVNPTSDVARIGAHILSAAQAKGLLDRLYSPTIRTPERRRAG